MKNMSSKEYDRRFKWLVHQTVETLGISQDEATRRVKRVLDFPDLKKLGGPDTREFQVAVDIMMQIPSRKPITKETMDEIVNANRSKPNTPNH